jgi:hypothetical protein
VFVYASETFYSPVAHRFERQQYMEVRDSWAGADPEFAGKNACSTYGAEHLCRLLGMYMSSLFLSNTKMSPSHTTGTHCANQHGCPVSQSFEGGAYQDVQLDRS